MGVLAPKIPLGGALGCLFAWCLWDAPGVGAFSLDDLTFVYFVFSGIIRCVGVCVCLLDDVFLERLVS